MNSSIKIFLLSLAFFLGGKTAFAQLENTTRDVARKHPNGKPYVVVYMKNTTGEIVKEEVYYSNGNLEWEGFYKRSIEDGSWKYYYQNGKLKIVGRLFMQVPLKKTSYMMLTCCYYRLMIIGGNTLKVET
jgi:hypothetical protein